MKSTTSTFYHPSTALVSGMVPGVALLYPLGIISIMNRITISSSISHETQQTLW